MRAGTQKRAALLQPAQAALLFGLYAAVEQSMISGAYTAAALTLIAAAGSTQDTARSKQALVQPAQAALLFGFYAALEQSMTCGVHGSLTRHRPPFTACTFYKFNHKVGVQLSIDVLLCTSFECESPELGL